MKVGHRTPAILLGVIVFATSCDTYHFANPLPVGSKSLYSTPGNLIGVIKAGDQGQTGYFLEKNSVGVLDKDTIRVFNGIWIDSSRDTSASSRKNYETRYRIKYDSLMKKYDTLDNYVIRGKRIWEVKDNRLTIAREFFIKGDTIYLPPVSFRIQLGPNAFYRKITSELYMLNIKDIETEEKGPEFGQWWQVYLLERKGQGSIVLYRFNEKIKEDPAMFFHEVASSHYYFDPAWTSKDILRMFNGGMFDAENSSK